MPTTPHVMAEYLRGDLAAEPRTLVDILEASAAHCGGAPAIDDGDVVLTYRQLLREVRAFAARLGEHGVVRGDRVGVRISSGTRRLYIAILGTLVAGAAYVPVDADDPDERADLVFGEAGVAAIVTDAGIQRVGERDAAAPESASPAIEQQAVEPPAPELPESEQQVAEVPAAERLDVGQPDAEHRDAEQPFVEPRPADQQFSEPDAAEQPAPAQVADAGSQPLPAQVTDAEQTAPADSAERHRRGSVAARPRLFDDAWIIFTSGSTGTPKGVAVSHRSAAAFVDAEARLFLQDNPLGPGDRVLAGLSVAFDASCEEMWLAWRHGACLVPAPRSLVRSGMDLGPWLVSQGITVVSTVPTLASLWPVDTLSQVRLLIFGGEGLPSDLAERLLDPDREVWNTYGPTEATVVACAAKMTGEPPVRIGLPLDGWDLVVVDDQEQPVAEGEVGQLIIGGVGLARYLDPAKDAEKFAPMPTLGWERAYRSGDLVRLEAPGLIFQGRADEQVKLGGRRIELGEIDAALQALPGVAGGACAVKTTGAGHQVLIGYVAVADGAPFDLDAAQAELRRSLPAALVPRLAVVDDLPTRTSGKVDRNALPWPLPGDSGGGSDDAEAGELTAEQAWLAEQWSAVLGARVGAGNDDFFTLGGGSLAAAQLVTLLRARYPRVTVGDLYSYPRLAAQAAMLDDQLPAATGPQVTRTISPMSRGSQLLQTALSFALLLIAGLKWLVGLLTVGTLLAPLHRLEWFPTASWWFLAPALLVFFTPPGQMGVAVLLSRLLLRGLTPGDYPRGGSVHLRIWFCERFAEVVGAASMAGAPWIIYYARALGAKVGRGVDLHAIPPVTGLLTLGGGCSIEPEVDLSGHWLDGDTLHVGKIRVAAHATVGARSTLLPGARVGRGATVEAGSAVHDSVPAAQVWAGSPAIAVKGKWQGDWPSTRPPRARIWLLVYAVSAVALALLPLLAAAPGVAIVVAATADAPTIGAALGPALLAVPLATIVAMAALALLTLVVVRLMSIGLREGYHPVRSRVGWQVWATERVLDSARTLLFPLYASLATPVWLRALGARIGSEVEASTVLLLPSMTRVGDGAFLADDTMIAAYELHGGWMRVEAARVGKRAFLGNSGMTAPGRKVPKDGLVAVLSTAPLSAKAGSSWMGSPPVRLRRAASHTDVSRTFSPPGRLKVARALVEACRVVPVMCTVAIAVLVAAGILALWTWSPWAAVLGAGVLLALAGLAAALLTVATKWLLVGRFDVVEHPLWSSFVWRNELADTFVETVAGPWFAWPATGTYALNVWLRAMGARIGKGVWCETYWLPESDLVRLGDGATVNRGCVLQTHLFHDRIMSMDTVTLEPGATMGPHGVILPAGHIGAATTVGPASLVLRGDTVPAHARWVGNPIAPWDEARVDA